MVTMAVTAIVRTRVQPPRLALLPAATPPGGGLLLSALIHTAAVFAVLTWLPVLFPGRAAIVAYAAPDMLREPAHQVLMLPVLPRMTLTGSRGGLEGRSGKIARSVAKAGPGAGRPTSDRPKPNYADPQEIVSNLPDATNDVQTFRRPDLVAPPKLKYPIRLQRLVMLPAPTTPALVTPQLEQPVLPNLRELATFRASKPRVKIPVLPIGMPKRSSVVPAEPVVPKIMGTSDHSLPVFAVTTVSAPKAVVVINAVSVPPESAPVIPDAELSGNFVVAPSDVNGLETTSGAGGGNIAGAGASNAGENSLHPSGGNGGGIGVNAGGGNAGVARPESLSSLGTRPGSGGGTGAAIGSTGLPGISISGGVSGRSGRAFGTSSIPRGSYALTIISGGSSGGASRDLGVFSRSDTVYTVCIPMTDAGGGPDWPIEYALMSSAPAGNGLLTPPIALKKIQATGPKTDLTANSGPVFIIGIINEKGKLQALRAIRTLDVRAQSAINALAQWEFLPAQLEGKPVASKILIGVSVMPTEEGGKQD